MPKPANLELKYHPNLSKPLKQLIEEGLMSGSKDEVLEITDPSVASVVYGLIEYE